MLTLESLYVFAFAIPIYQILFYTIQLISFKRHNPARIYIGLLLLTLSLVLILNAIYHLGYLELFSKVYFVYVPLLLSIFPLFYLYISSLTETIVYKTLRAKLLLFIPLLLILILNIAIDSRSFSTKQLHSFDLTTVINRQETLASAFVYHLVVLKFVLPLLLLLQLFLTVLKMTRIFKYENEKAKDNASHLAYFKPGYQRVNLVSLVIFILALIVPLAYLKMQGSLLPITFNLILLVTGGTIGYFALKQNRLFLDVNTMDLKPDATFQKSISASLKSNLSQGHPSLDLAVENRFLTDVEIKQIMQQLEIIMNENKPYLDAGFSLSDLCRLTNTDRRKMTYFLNNVLNKNFYGFINEYRMKEVIDHLEGEEKRYTIEGIAEKVGFRSKSSFYVCFKKYTGLTPKEYLSKNQSQ